MSVQLKSSLQMISKYILNAGSVFRNVSVFCQVNQTLKVKNLFKKCTLYQVSSVCFSIKSSENENIQKKNLKILKVWKNMSVKELATGMNLKIRDLAMFFPHLNLEPNTKIESIEVFTKVAHKLGWKFQMVKNPKETSNIEIKNVSPEPSSHEIKNWVPRPPVVTVMGHVDHGKTTLLDSLRNTFVAQGEFGGITQHIGAFSVEVKPGIKITFIDTPGHAAFTVMRSRGAQVTDLVVLVVAADDGVMEQTVESIRIAKEAKVRMIIAVNKIDKNPNNSLEDIKEKLLLEGIQVEDRGGDIQMVPISALKKINLDLLIDVILLEAELMELRADPTGMVKGVIIESKKGTLGIVATLIVKSGTLRKGKILVAGKAHGKVRKMTDENGKEYQEALPSSPVQILGWKELPLAGDVVFEVNSEKEAVSFIRQKEKESMIEKQMQDAEVIEKKAAEHQKLHHETQKYIKSLESAKERRKFLYESQKLVKTSGIDLEDTSPHLKVILKGDVYGTLEVLLKILGSYDKEEECKLTIVDSSVGDIKLKDLENAELSNGIIYAFNVNLHNTVAEYIKDKNIDIRYHNVLYRLIDDVKEELNSRIEPKDVEEINGEAEVLENFMITYASKKVPVAGARCITGQLKKESLFRVLRNDEVIYEGSLLVMKNEKKIVKLISKGMECGLLFDSFPDKFKPQDKIICYDMKKVPRKTTWDPGF